MNQECFLCDNAGANITERPDGYDGNYVHCPECSNYKITRNAVHKLMHGHKAPVSISSRVKDHFEKTGDLYEVNTVTLSLSD